MNEHYTKIEYQIINIKLSKKTPSNSPFQKRSFLRQRESCSQTVFAEKCQDILSQRAVFFVQNIHQRRNLRRVSVRNDNVNLDKLGAGYSLDLEARSSRRPSSRVSVMRQREKNR